MNKRPFYSLKDEADFLMTEVGLHNLDKSVHPNHEKAASKLQSENLGLTDKPSVQTGATIRPKSRERTIITLVPNWEEKRRMCRIRQKTMLRIFLSKWFYKGLEWYERELLLILMRKNHIPTDLLDLEILPSEFALRNKTDEYQSTRVVVERPLKAINCVGLAVFEHLVAEDQKKSFDSRGFLLLSFQSTLDLLYTEIDFTAVSKLRSFQSLYDILFQPFSVEQVGKIGVSKTRKRGYTDGRGSSGDSHRTRMALEADRFFWGEQHSQKWDDLHSDIEKMCKT
jgi:hypothetical protein